MTRSTLKREAGFTLVELTVVVVISALTLMAIYQTLLTQEQTYRHQTASINAQGATRTGIQLLTTELREVSAAAGAEADRAGSDVLAAAADSIRFRAFRKSGLTCAVDTSSGVVHVWTMGTAFASGDTVMAFLEADSLTDEDDVWAADLQVTAGASSHDLVCSAEWGTYDVQQLGGFDPDTLGLMERGALIRSYNIVTYGAFQLDGEWVLGRRSGANGEMTPLVGPIMPPDSNGIRFRYFDEHSAQLTPTTEAIRARIARIEITMRAVSHGGLRNENYVDSLTTNVYLRGN